MEKLFNALMLTQDAVAKLLALSPVSPDQKIPILRILQEAHVELHDAMDDYDEDTLRGLPPSGSTDGQEIISLDLPLVLPVDVAKAAAIEITREEADRLLAAAMELDDEGFIIDESDVPGPADAIATAANKSDNDARVIEREIFRASSGQWSGRLFVDGVEVGAVAGCLTREEAEVAVECLLGAAT